MREHLRKVTPDLAVIGVQDERSLVFPPPEAKKTTDELCLQLHALILSDA
jgi:hypothetical protein